MKNLSSVIIAAVVILVMFSSVAYTSCRRSADNCEAMICQHGGTCNNGICSCLAGYEGRNCETKTDPCKNVVCQNGGACGVGGQCFCPYGFTGRYCEINKCDGVSCLNGGRCLDGNCECADGYEGTHCETAIRQKYFGSWKTSQSLYPVLTNGETIIKISDGGSAYAGSANVSGYSSTGTPLFGFTASVSPQNLHRDFGEVSISGGYARTKLSLTLQGDTLEFSYSFYDKLSPEKGKGSAKFTKE